MIMSGVEQGVRAAASELCKETGRMVADPEELIGVRQCFAQPARGIGVDVGVRSGDE